MRFFTRISHTSLYPKKNSCVQRQTRKLLLSPSKGEHTTMAQMYENRSNTVDRNIPNIMCESTRAAIEAYIYTQRRSQRKSSYFL